MARQPEELAEMRRVLGAQLTTYRTAAELSQGQLGKAVFRDRTTVNHIEKGRTPGVEKVQRALRLAEDEYARLYDRPDQWIIGAAVLPDQSELPAGRANVYSRLAAHNRRFAENAVTDMTEALTLRDPSRARAILWGRITLATNQYRCGETDLANTSTEQVLATIGQVNSPRTARDVLALGTEIRQRTTDSTALDLAHRVSTEPELRCPTRSTSLARTTANDEDLLRQARASPSR